MRTHRGPPRPLRPADPGPASPGAPRRDDLLVPGFRLHQDGALAVYYAPFDHVNERSRVVVVGITPGWAQMEVSFRQARADLLAGRPLPEVAERAKYA